MGSDSYLHPTTTVCHGETFGISLRPTTLLNFLISEFPFHHLKQVKPSMDAKDANASKISLLRDEESSSQDTSLDNSILIKDALPWQQKRAFFSRSFRPIAFHLCLVLLYPGLFFVAIRTQQISKSHGPGLTYCTSIPHRSHTSSVKQGLD